jgi:CBS domain-containing protein
MKVEDLMTKKVICAHPNFSLTDVAGLLIKHHIHALPIAESDSSRLMGIITETDLVLKDECSRYLNQGTLKYELDAIERKGKIRDYKFEKTLNVSVTDLMSKNCITIFPDNSLEELISAFRKTQFHSLPVIQSDDVLLGIITLSDILKLY